jgi:hypothetical protein
MTLITKKKKTKEGIESLDLGEEHGMTFTLWKCIFVLYYYLTFPILLTPKT